MSQIGRIITEKNIWLTSCMFFIAGILLPMFTFHKFILLNDTFSLLGGIVFLLKEGELFLFIVVFAFSIVGPIYKFHLIGILVKDKEIDKDSKAKIVKRLAIIGKWSMADVFVIAILVATVKLGLMGGISVHVGIIFFGISVLLSMLLVQKQMAGYELRPKIEET